MSFLKNHWQFTVAAVVVLCVLLLGAVALYSASEPPESKTVYEMPERNPDNPPTLNTGGIMTVETVPSANTRGETESRETELASDSENLESRCPEEELLSEPASADDATGNFHIHSPTPEAIEDARKHREFIRSLLAHGEEAQALVNEWLSFNDEEEQADKIVHNGELIVLFDEIGVDESGHIYTGRLTADEAVKYVKQVQARYDDIARRKEAAWQRLQEWEQLRPIEPTYTSKEYATDH